MRLVSRSYTKGGEGYVKLIPEEGEGKIFVWTQPVIMKILVQTLLFCSEDSCAGEDMWHVYNLVRAGDRVTAVTFRKIAVQSSGGSESERVKIKLTIAVEAIDFDPEGQPSPRHCTSSTHHHSLGRP
jgi:protein pelota